MRPPNASGVKNEQRQQKHEPADQQLRTGPPRTGGAVGAPGGPKAPNVNGLTQAQALDILAPIVHRAHQISEDIYELEDELVSTNVRVVDVLDSAEEFDKAALHVRPSSTN